MIPKQLAWADSSGTSQNDRVPGPLHPGVQLGIGCFVLTAILLGLVLNQAWLPVVIVAGGYAAIWCVRDAFRSLLLYVFMAVAVMLQAPREGHTTALDVLAGVVMVGVAVYWFVKVRLVEWQPFSVDRFHLLLVLYFGWTMLIGVGGMLYFNNTVNDWLREMIIQLPLVVVPFLFVRGIKPDSREEKYLYLFLVVAWVVLIVVNMVHFRNHVVKAFYLYQTGRAMLDPSSSILLLLVCASFAALEQRRTRLKFYVLFAALAIVAIVLAGYRTVWLTILLVAPILYWASRPAERKQERRFGFWLGVLGVVSLGYSMLRWRLIRLLAIGFVQRFATSSKVKTDLSLVNRYIEWRVLFRFIRASPLVGYGFGARYFDYDWLLGYSLWTGYSHNAFLYVLLKSGVIGFTALFGAFVLLMFRALKLSRSIYLKANQRAAMRVAFALSFTMLITSMTLNALGDRTALVWLGIVWGSVMIYNREEKRLSHL